MCPLLQLFIHRYALMSGSGIVIFSLIHVLFHFYSAFYIEEINR